MKLPKNTTIGGAFLLAAALGGVGGCSHPLAMSTEQQLREQLIASHRAYVEAVSAAPMIELSRKPSETEADLPEDRRVELDTMSGPAAYEGKPLELGPDLTDEEATPTIAMTLRRVIHQAVQNNLDVQVARLLPGVAETQLTQAEAAFDATYFASFQMEKLDTPQPPTDEAFSVFGSVKSDERVFSTGIRKLMSSGGQVSVQTDITRNFRRPSFFADEVYYGGSVSASISQPLLRNFGADVNRSQIMLAANARRQGWEQLKQQLLVTAADTEKSYWDLVFARQRLLILTRLYQRTVEDHKLLKERLGFDVPPATFTDVTARLENRRTDVIRARQLVRVASDALKRQINAADLPVAGETLILPLEVPADLPIQFSLLDSVTTALQHRPEMQRALLEINDAGIRQRVADNQRLPSLDLAATVRWNGVSVDDIGDGYDAMTEGNFIDYILAAQFEMPIGNRGPEALYAQRKIERRATVINYQRTAQTVVVEVKNSLRSLLTAYELIGATRAARRAAADNLRALQAQIDAGVALTPEFIDLKLRREEALSDAELQEVGALTDYNTSIARFYQTVGTLLSRNGIDLAEEANQP